MPVSAASFARERVRAPPGERLRLHARGLRSAGVGGEVAAERELLQAHELRALLGGAANALRERRFVFGGVGMPALLHEPDPKMSPARGQLARERDVWPRGGDHVLDLAHVPHSRRLQRPPIPAPAPTSGSVVSTDICRG